MVCKYFFFFIRGTGFLLTGTFGFDDIYLYRYLSHLNIVLCSRYLIHPSGQTLLFQCKENNTNFKKIIHFCKLVFYSILEFFQPTLHVWALSVRELFKRLNYKQNVVHDKSYKFQFIFNLKHRSCSCHNEKYCYCY